jgi:predicted GNAT family acetyltransferase
MAWTFTDDVGTYTAAVGGLLSEAPEHNTVLLSVLASLTGVGPAAFGPAPPLLGWWSDRGPVRAAILQTPPHPLLMTGLPDNSADGLARALADRGTGLPGISGAEQDAAALAQAWRDLTGRTGRVSQRQRLYRLSRLIPPDPAPRGAPRIAAIGDTSLIRTWYSAFAAETGTEDLPPALIEERLGAGRLMLWEAPERLRGGLSGARAPDSRERPRGGLSDACAPDSRDEPVSLAGMTAVIAGTARIGPVYTPPQSRGRGYGSAVTAAITQLATSRGAESVVLFTDLANPTSNSIYRRLGYEPVEDRVLITYDS